MITKKQSKEYWNKITKERERKRARKLASGDLVIGMDKNGKPITLPKKSKT